jgi:hypothetical protein
LTIAPGKRTRRVARQAALVEALPCRPSVRLRRPDAFLRRPDAFLRRCRRIFASPMQRYLMCVVRGLIDSGSAIPSYASGGAPERRVRPVDKETW